MKVPDWGRWLTRDRITLFVILIFVAVIGLYCLMPLWLVLWGSTNHIPAKYTYTVTIQDLNSCTSDGGVEVLVPIPYVNGQQVFTDEELDETCGDWHCAVKMTEYGKMLSITTSNKTLNTFGVRYTKNAKDVLPVSSAKGVNLSAFSAASDPDMALFDRELALYESTTRHPPAYKNWINYSDPYGWSLGYTAVKINGNIRKPEKRKSIVVDMYFEALSPVPDGCQPPAYLLCSYAEMDQTNNSTYTPVVLRYGPFSRIS